MKTPQQRRAVVNVPFVCQYIRCGKDRLSVVSWKCVASYVWRGNAVSRVAEMWLMRWREVWKICAWHCCISLSGEILLVPDVSCRLQLADTNLKLGQVIGHCYHQDSVDLEQIWLPFRGQLYAIYACVKMQFVWAGLRHVVTFVFLFDATYKFSGCLLLCLTVSVRVNEN